MVVVWRQFSTLLGSLTAPASGSELVSQFGLLFARQLARKSIAWLGRALIAVLQQQISIGRLVDANHLQSDLVC